MDFSALKKASKSKNSNSIEDLQKQIDQLENKGYEDNRFWSIERDKNGNGEATIRFLERDKELPKWVKVHSHGFQGLNGQWLIDQCPTSIGKKCPVCESNSELWNTGIEANKEIVRKRKRKLHYYMNILVVNDPKNPENNGKVFLFKAGKKIFDKIKTKISPEFDSQKPVDVFNLWSGANFHLRVKTVDKFPNYDDSEFAEVSPISPDDKEIEKIWSAQHDLAEFESDDYYPSYEKLEERLKVVLGEKTSDPAPQPSPPQTTTQTETAPPPSDNNDDDDMNLDELLEMAEGDEDSPPF